MKFLLQSNQIYLNNGIFSCNLTANSSVLEFTILYIRTEKNSENPHLTVEY